MRGLIFLCFTVVTVTAHPGYNYHSHQKRSNQYLAPAGGSGYDSHEAQGYHQQPLVTKRFFIHSAPEEEDVEVHHKEILVGTPRKNFNVVFVKSAATNSQKTKIRIIPAVNEDKTVIYVLAKKGGENEVTAHVEETAAPNSKPEVHFIKYKTNEEAEYAQRSIQAEYDHLGGSTVISNEGISPVSSVIGSLDGHGAGYGGSSSYDADVGNAFATGGGGGGAVGHDGGLGSGAGGSGYLPPVKKH